MNDIKTKTRESFQKLFIGIIKLDDIFRYNENFWNEQKDFKENIFLRKIQYCYITK